MAFRLNGAPATARTDDPRSLLGILRDDFGCTSLKNGCEPQAACGCCLLTVNDGPRLSCTMTVSQVAGKQVTTLEGLPGETRRELAECFVRSGAVQCGFCIPGIAMRAHALVRENPNPTRQQVEHELRAHLCRCTGYVKIVDAIVAYAAVSRGEAHPPADRTGKVGTSYPRYGGHDLALGEFRYVDDVRVEGCLFAALRFSDHPRALVRSIDARAAAAADGVVRVITAADVPGNRHVGLIVSDWPILVAVGEETRYVGDVIAVAVASDARAARAAAAAVAVDYDVRAPVSTPDEALAPGAPRLHPSGNLLSRSVVARGDAAQALAASAHVVEETFQTQMVEHMFLEPESSIAIPSMTGGGDVRLTVLSQGQGVFDDRRQVASILGWDVARVEVRLVQNGGAFGGKEDLSIQGHTALAAALCGRPVKCTLRRDESFRLHPKRHGIRIRVAAGCDAEGRLTAVRARMVGDTGAYASVGAKVLERAAGHACGPYRVPAVDVEALAVYTNNPPCGAMRGFGANQAAFAMEGVLDRLARRVGIDGWEIRWRNALDVGDRFATGQKLDKPFGLKRTLMAVRDAYRGARFAGIACGIKNVGIGNGMPDPGKALLRVTAPDRVEVRTGFTEMGQGFFTVCVQVASQETGLPPAVFHPVTDTSVELNCGQTTASRATVLGAAAIVAAAGKLRAELDAGRTLGDLIGREYRGEWVCDYTTKPGADVSEPKTHLTYGFATQVVTLDEDGRVERVIAAHDVGRAINPTLLAGQIEGSIHMGLGYALTEEFVVAGCHVVTDTVKSIGVLRAHQMPRVECVFVEEPDAETAYGARGVGEIGLVPTAPAVAGALAAFDGTYRTTLPMKDSPAAKAMWRRNRVRAGAPVTPQVNRTSPAPHVG